MKKVVLFLYLFSITLLSRAELMIEITQGIDNPTPVAVSPFSWSGNQPLPEDISAIVETDLRRCGLFDLLSKDSMLSYPDRPQDVLYRDWRALGRDYLVIGRIYPVGNDIEVAYYLFDVVRQKAVISSKMRSSREGLRDIAHLISDNVFQSITNIPGAFSTKIMYVSSKVLGKGKYNYQLIVADSDGERSRQILNSAEPILSPAWSPDGKRIAYASYEGGRPAIYLQTLATGAREKLPSFRGINSSPAWSPDGKQMALVLSKDGSPDIYVLDLVTKSLRKVAENDIAIDTEPQWMPDGKSIVFTSNRGGKPQVYEVDAETGKNVRRLTFEGDYNARPRPIMDGSGLIVVHRKNGLFHIARVDTRNNRVEALTGTALDESPSISANGTMVMYATKKGGQGILAAVSIDGRFKFNLPAAGRDIREPAWSPFLTNQ